MMVVRDERKVHNSNASKNNSKHNQLKSSQEKRKQS